MNIKFDEYLLNALADADKYNWIFLWPDGGVAFRKSARTKYPYINWTTVCHHISRNMKISYDPETIKDKCLSDDIRQIKRDK